MTDLEVIIRILAASLIGGIIGVEREINNRPAGLRTHILVCVGATLVMMTSIFVAEKYNIDDHSRMAAQVVSGIGLLGAGTIMVRGFDIKGLTTAASLWVDAALGLSVGAGFYLGAIIGSVVVIVSLQYLGRIERKISSRRIREIIIDTSNEREVYAKIDDLIHHNQGELVSLRMDSSEKTGDKSTILHMEVYLPLEVEDKLFFGQLKDMEGINSINYNGRVLKIEEKK